MNISRRNMNRILARALSGSLLFTAALPVRALAQTDDGNQTEDERQIAEETAASLQDGVLEYGELQDMIRLSKVFIRSAHCQIDTINHNVASMV